MYSGREYSKNLTSVTGANITNSSTQSFKHVELANIPETTPGSPFYKGEADSMNVLSGAGGDGTTGTPDKSPSRWGYTSPSGSRFEVNDTAGSERIDIVHNSGAGIAIDPDGAIFVVSQSTRGAGIAAPFGDVYISASGDIVIRGSASMSVITSGDMIMEAGGNMTLKSDSLSIMTKNYNAVIDGQSSTNITTDKSEVVGGIERSTVAGDYRKQITGNSIDDVGGNRVSRIGGDSSTDVGGDNNISQKGNLNSSTGGDQSISSSGTSKISSEGEGTVYSGGSLKVTGDSVDIKGSGAVKLNGGSVHSNPPIDLAKWADDTQQAALASSLGGSVGSKPSPQSAASGSAGTVNGPKDAQVMEANDIVDTLTSARKYPQYMGNGVHESADSTGLGLVAHDRDPNAEEVLKDYSSSNTGNSNPAQEAEIFDTIPESDIQQSENITNTKNSMAIPSRNDHGAKISKYLTLGQLLFGTGSSIKPSASVWNTVVPRGMEMAQNVLDPLKEKFPDLIVTSWYRTNSRNHITGYAVDIRVRSRSMTKNAEMARYAAENLPVDQVFLEKNSSGYTHLHLRYSPNKTKPKILTCGDKNCNVSVPGIQVAWLARRAK